MLPKRSEVEWRVYRRRIRLRWSGKLQVSVSYSASFKGDSPARDLRHSAGTPAYLGTRIGRHRYGPIPAS